MEAYKKISGNGIVNLQIGFLILMVLPFLILYYFNHPTAEDFYYEEITKKIGFIDAQRLFFKFWGGRYMYYALISTNPLIFKSIAVYNVLLCLIMISFFIILFLFISQFIRNSLTFKERLLFSLSIFFLYLHTMPSVSHGFYWLGSVICYHLAVISILLFFIAYVRLSNDVNLHTKIIYSVICSLAVIAIAGFNEIAASIFLMSLVFLLLKNVFIDKKIYWPLVFFVIITSIAVYIAFTAPGNSQRSEYYTDKHRFIYSIYNSGTFLLQQLISWTINSPLLAFTFLLIPFFLKIIKTNKPVSAIFSINPVYSVTLLIVFLYSGIFVMSWSVGVLPFDRILNTLYFLFLIGWFCNIIVLFYYLNRKFDISGLKYPKYLNAISYIIIVFFLIRENNIRTAYSDLLGGAAQKFRNDMNERYDYILQNNSDSCKIDSIYYVPKTFFLKDIDYDPKSVYNQGYAAYFNKKSIILK